MPPVAPRLPLGKGKVKGKGKQALFRLARLRWAALEIQMRREALEIQLEALEIEIEREIETIEREVEARTRRARAEYLRSMNPWRWILIGDL